MSVFALPTRKNLTPYIPLLVFALCIGLIALAAFYSVRKFEKLIEVEKVKDLGAIADMKIEQIVSWRAGHMKRAAAFSNSGLLAPEFEQWLKEGRPAGEREHKFLRVLSGLQLTHGYVAASLLDQQGVVRITSGNTDTLDEDDVKLALGAMNGLQPLFSDIHRSRKGGESVTISLAAPLIESSGKKAHVVGAVLLQIDPQEFLYPLVQSWPSSSASAETLLTRQDGSEVVFLNELRHRKGTALSLHVPASSLRLPTVMAIRGATSTKNGIDYRGVPVVAAMRKVPGTSWFMIAKVDRDEIFAPINEMRKWTTGLGFAFTLLGGGFFLVWLQGMLARQKQLKAEHDAALEREMLFRHFEYLTRYANDMIIVADETGRIVEANERAQQTLGYGREELLRMRIMDLHAPLDRSALPDKLETLKREGALVVDGVYQRKVGDTFPVEISARVIEVHGARYLQGIVRDTTERKQAERRIHRLNNLYAAISRSNEAIVQFRERDRLFQEICRIAVKYGQFKLAWIGLLDDETHTVKVAAFTGEASEYLDGIHIAIDDDKPEGCGPTGKSVRDDRESICNDFINDPSTRPWQESAKKFGLMANASCPLRLEGRAVGALSLYAGEVNYFDRDMVHLLTDLARDISLALDNFVREERRIKVETMLQASEEHFRFLAENSTDMVYRMSLPDGRYEYVSTASLKLFGYAPEEFYNAPALIRDIIHPDWHDYFATQWASLVAGEMPPSYEYQIIHKSGETRWMHQRNSPIWDSRGALIAIQGVVTDITERKRAEEELRESEARFRNMADSALALIWLSDTENFGTWFSKGWLEYTGRTLEEELGVGWAAGVHPDDLSWCVSYRNDAFRARQRFKMEFRLRRADGSYGWVADTGIPRFTPAGEFEGYIGYCWDITEHKLYEEMREKMEHAGRLNVAAEMASGLAHELSQPLSACNNYLDGCLRRMNENDWDKEKLHNAVQLAHKQAGRAGRIINHLKDLVRKQGHERSLIDINLLVREVIGFLDDEIKRQGISISMTLFPLPHVMGCRVEIEQVLLNLFKNAIEAMHSCPRRELHIVTSPAAEHGFALVAVSDTGKGILPAEVDNLFNPFQSTKREGLGLGLAICRTTVENHGGRIWVDPQRELGAEFFVTFPVGHSCS